MDVYTCQNIATCHLTQMQSTIPTLCLNENTRMHLSSHSLLYGHKLTELEELDRIPRDKYKEIYSVWVAQNCSGIAMGYD